MFYFKWLLIHRLESHTKCILSYYLMSYLVRVCPILPKNSHIDIGNKNEFTQLEIDTLIYSLTTKFSMK